MRRCIAISTIVLLAAGCQSLPDQASALHQAQDAGNRVSVGAVQREIRTGMSGAEVVQVLGSPNMVTTDERRRETWVWDKVATETMASSSSGGGGLIFFGAGGGSGVRSTTQRTLTVIVKFDEQGRVRDYSYRSSSF